MISYKFNRLFVLILILHNCIVFSQTKTISIDWAPNLEVILDGGTRSIPKLSTSSYKEGVPYFSYHEPVAKGNYNVQFSTYQTVLATTEDLWLLNYYHKDVPATLEAQGFVELDGKDNRLLIGVFPYIKQNGTIQRIISVNYSLQPKITQVTSKPKNYVANSVLATGTWYKITVSEDGVYKLSKEFLTSLGIDLENVKPKSIHVFGNSFGRLNERNNAPYVDDLLQDAVQYVGLEDTTFDNEDYILFYGVSPNTWKYDNTNGFTRDQHIYSTTTSYFICVDENRLPKEIDTTVNDDSGVTHNVSNYDFYTIYENETTSIVQGGQRWYGELFDGILTQSINFSIPDMVSGQTAKLTYAFATNAKQSGNTFSLKNAGNVIGTLSMSVAGDDYARNVGTTTWTQSGSALNLEINFNRINAATKGYLDFVNFNGIRNLSYVSGGFGFRYVASVGPGNKTRYNLSGNLNGLKVWEVTSRTEPSIISGLGTLSSYTFSRISDTLREFYAFKESDIKTPKAVGGVLNQDLHGLGHVDFVIVTHPNFVAQANRLKGLHESMGTSVHVVTTEEVYNEFSGGLQDATAIRRMMKMFYDRANGDVTLQPKSLLLFGDATYDPKGRVGNNNYMVPTYQVLNSESHIAAMVTDDYFGILGDNAAIDVNDIMQISVGRLLISNNEQALQQVNKIEHYLKNGSQLFASGANSCCLDNQGSTFGDWRLNYSLITDDEEQSYFIKYDAEPAYKNVVQYAPEMNCDKIYSDAYVQVASAGGQRYPEVYDAITRRVENGALVMNYIGHGGEVGAAEERIITIDQINSWQNIDKLNCFVTATCEFTKFDDPSRVSAGEWISLNPTGGAIALLTTTRSVYFSVNTNTIEALFDVVFTRDANNEPLTFGEIMRKTKNTSGLSDNRRSFNLIGDPMLKIALPRYSIVVDSINHIAVSSGVLDTIQALSMAHISGHVEGDNGAVMTTMNGVLSPTILDKKKMVSTLKNDPQSTIQQFETQKNAVYKGKASIKNGYFAFQFYVPKDIEFAVGKGRISLYGNNESFDAAGVDTNFYIGGLNTNAVSDDQGPSIDLYLNDKSFVNGGITSPAPLLVAEVSDEFGINTVGNGVGHDLIAILDGNTSEPIVLNEYYVGNLDSYQSGKIQYPLGKMSLGKHYLEVKIWDSNNNSNTARIDFEVTNDDKIGLSHVLNYPNPFTTHTEFFFEHNQSCTTLDAQVQIYTVAGRLVKTINQTVNAQGFRSDGIAWDGKDDYGDQLAKGVYVYRVSVEMPDGTRAEQLEKLVLLK